MIRERHTKIIDVSASAVRQESFRSVNGRTPVPESEESRAWLQAKDSWEE